MFMLPCRLRTLVSPYTLSSSRADWRVKSSCFSNEINQIFLLVVLILTILFTSLLYSCYSRRESSWKRDSMLQTKWLRMENVSAWAELEKLRWKREFKHGASIDLMLQRKTFMEAIVQNNTIKELWQEEIDRYSSRGILISAGNGEQLTNAFASMHSLRNVLQCKLPVFISYWGNELNKSSIGFVKEHIPNVEFLDLSGFSMPSYHLPVFDGWPSPRDRNEGYMVKILALRAVPFKEIIFMDSDCIALQNPETLFDELEYLKHGSLFWPDFWRKGNQLWSQFGVNDINPWSDGDINAFRKLARRKAQKLFVWRKKALNELPLVPRQAETGEFLFNKMQHWDVLEWLLFLNMHHNITYSLDGVLGDKDTFSLAFALAGKMEDYVQVNIGPSAALVDYETHGNPLMVPRYRAIGNIQLKPDGSMIFNHKTIDKIPRKGDPQHRVWPVDLVTAEVSDAQAKVLVNGGWKWKLGRHKGIFGLKWGFLDSELAYFECEVNCSCSVEKINEVERACTGRSEQQKEIPKLAWPVAAVKVPNDHLARKATAILAEALALLPPNGL